MSDVSMFIKGKLTPEEFVAKAAADIKKDTAFFQAMPFAKTLETWAIDAIFARLSGVLSPTISALVCREIKVLLGIATPDTAGPPPGFALAGAPKS